jgi:hypothetical protein
MTPGSGVSRWRARPDDVRVARRALAAVLATTAVAGAGRARAETAYDLLPAGTIGITDNAAAAADGTPRHGDGFSQLSVIGRVHRLTMHSDNTLGLRLSETFYFRGYGPTAFNAELSGVSAMTLDASWQLRLAAGLTFGQTSMPTRLDVNSGLPEVVPANGSYYVSGAATGEGLYEFSPRTRLAQLLRFTGVDYLSNVAAPNMIGPPPVQYSLVVGATLRFEHDILDNLLVAEGDVADSIVPNRSNSMNPVYGLPDQVYLVQLVAGWRRDFGLAWSGELKLGALGIFDNQGTTIIEPAGILTVGYRQLYWFATLIASQQAAPNVFIAAATVNDSLQARFALPIGRSERFYALGYASYIYARLADSAGLHQGYQQWLAGASLTARSEKYPLWGSIDYMYSTQEGNITAGGTIPSLERQSLMVTVGGAFTTGHQQPTIFHGVMGAIRPLTDQTSGNPAGVPTSYGAGSSSLETPGAPGWSGSGEGAVPPGASGSKSKGQPAPSTPGAPGWSGTPTTTDTPGAPGWSGSTAPPAPASGNVQDVTR